MAKILCTSQKDISSFIPRLGKKMLSNKIFYSEKFATFISLISTYNIPIKTSTFSL